jgi:hypothetical protein
MSTVTGTTPSSKPYGPVTGGYGAKGGTKSHNEYVSLAAQCSGAITTTFTWSGLSPAPQSTIIQETCNVSCSADSYGYQTNGPPSAAAADGMGDTASITDTKVNVPNSQETMAGSAGRTRYTVNNGGQSISLSCSPSASAYTPNGTESHADVAYSAAVYPVIISPGGATSDGNGGYDILVGQHCAPTLSPPPPGCTYSNYQWSVTGTTFQSWTVSADQSQAVLVNGSGALNVTSPSWYWNDLSRTSETITCTATLTPPAGEGSAFSVTATQQVNVMVPMFDGEAFGGYMKVNPISGGYYLQAVKSPQDTENDGGMEFQGFVETPTSPAFGQGELELVQIAIPNES